MKVLVTGGTGYIGSHTVVELLEENHEVVIIDNLNNSKEETLDNIEKITGKKVKFYNEDLRNKEVLEKIFTEEGIDAVIHFAGFKAVGESVEKPLMYFDNNLISTINLLEVMKEHDVKKLVFSSSCTVYGVPETVPITEDSPLSVMSPYGRTKLIIEDMLRDLTNSDDSWSVIILRYFNPIGAHKSGLIGENPNGIPNNLMPLIVKVANKEMNELKVFGNDYDTKDGTCVRDYIHVVDLAKGHIKALNKLDNKGAHVYNLGTGKGYSVLDIIETFKRVNNVDVPYIFAPRRSGDVPMVYANPEKAFNELGWKAELDIEDMCRDSYNYVVNYKKIGE